MKKIIGTIIVLFVLCGVLVAQVQSISMTTANAVGTSFSFYLSCSTASSVQVDFGDGILVTKTVNSSVTNIGDTVRASQNVRVFGTGITLLNCPSCGLTGLDVGSCPTLSSVNCSNNQLTALNVGGNGSLKELYFTNNKLTTIDLSRNLVLERLSCSTNLLTQLDVSGNTSLRFCDCIWMVGITRLDFSHNPLLESLDCRICSITSLDVSQCPLLASLCCFNNQLASIDLAGNPELKTLNCSSNLLESLDVSHNTKLNILNCQTNKIPALDVSRNKALTQFFCSTNQLASIDVSNNPGLIYFFCSKNHLTSVDVTNNLLLKEFECGTNKISSVDVSQNTLLTSINASANLLTSFDVGANTALLSLDCSGNGISTLSVAANTLLTRLSINNNKIKTIDISGNPALATLLCYNNYFKFGTLALPTAQLSSYYYSPQYPVAIPQIIYVGEELDYLSDEKVIGGVWSTYSWVTTKGVVLAEGVDYTLTNGLTVFLKPQTDSVRCEMSNGIFPKFSTYTTLKTTYIAVKTDPGTLSTQTIMLQKGWNLVSTSLRTGDSSIATLFAGLDVGEVKSMDAYWRKGQADAFNSLRTITPGYAYLVNMNTAGELMVAGTPNLEGFQNLEGLQAGWQLIGCPFQSATPFSNYFSASNCSEIKNFEGFWVPGGLMNSILNIEPGKGYYIK